MPDSRRVCRDAHRRARRPHALDARHHSGRPSRVLREPRSARVGGGLTGRHASSCITRQIQWNIIEVRIADGRAGARCRHPEASTSFRFGPRPVPAMSMSRTAVNDGSSRKRRPPTAFHAGSPKGRQASWVFSANAPDSSQFTFLLGTGTRVRGTARAREQLMLSNMSGGIATCTRPSSVKIDRKRDVVPPTAVT